MSDLSVAMLCVTVLASAGLAYHAFRKHLERVSKSALEALRDELHAEFVAAETSLAERIEVLREDNKAEFAAMKTAFDRATSREALATANAVRGPNAREY